MIPRKYSKHEKATITARADKMRDKGIKMAVIAKLLAVPAHTLDKWVPARSRHRPAEIDYDTEAGCWRIYIYDTRWSHRDAQNGKSWWPLEWLHFATAEAAEAHLELHGEYRPVA